MDDGSTVIGGDEYSLNARARARTGARARGRVVLSAAVVVVGGGGGGSVGVVATCVGQDSIYHMGDYCNDA